MKAVTETLRTLRNKNRNRQGRISSDSKNWRRRKKKKTTRKILNIRKNGAFQKRRKEKDQK